MRSLVISDVHANLAALEAVFADADWDDLVFLGDAIITGPRPAGVLDALAACEGVYLEGNHDRDPLRIDPDRDPSSPHEAWTHWTRTQLDDRHIDIIDSFGDTRVLRNGGRSLRLHHGNFDPTGLASSFEGRLWPDSPDVVYEQVADRFPEPIILHGHAHIQFDRTVAGTRFVNPGSVGAPRLGEPQACYGILADGELSLHATAYDVERTCAAMDELPLEDGFIDAWKAAYWAGTLPDRYDLRDFEPLRQGSYR